MIDNTLLLLPGKSPQLTKYAKGKPFENDRGILFSPRFLNGKILRFDATLKGLRLSLLPDRAYLANSLHKFSKGNNYTDFTSSELILAIREVSDMTGFDWSKAEVKKIEYGCNISTNARTIISSLLSFKTKDYLPMSANGKMYGKSCEFEHYRIKGYDKQQQVKCVERLDINRPLFRWEIVVKQPAYLQRLMATNKVTVEKIIKVDNLELMCNDAVKKFQDSIKTHLLNLHLLKAEEKKIIAVMLHPEIKQEFKSHHARTFKKYSQIFKAIMNRQEIVVNNDCGRKIAEKMMELITN